MAKKKKSKGRITKRGYQTFTQSIKGNWLIRETRNYDAKGNLIGASQVSGPKNILLGK